MQSVFVDSWVASEWALLRIGRLSWINRAWRSRWPRMEIIFHRVRGFAVIIGVDVRLNGEVQLLSPSRGERDSLIRGEYVYAFRYRLCS